MPGAAVGRFVILHATGAIVGLGIREGMHRLAVGMQLPVRAGRGEFLRDGEYVLAMFMDNDIPTIYGRDLFGEPKKIADSALLRRGDAFRGWVDRGGVRIIELQGEMSNDTGPFDAEGYNFNFKARPAAKSRGSRRSGKRR